MAVAYIAGILNDSAFNYRLKIEIEKLKPQIKAKLIPKGGVLLCVTYTQNVDFGYKSFGIVFIAGSGLDSKTALTNFQSIPQMAQGATAAFFAGQLYIWVKEI